MSIGYAIAGGFFGRLNEMVQEEKELELAKAKTKKDKGLEIMDWFKTDQGRQGLKLLAPSLLQQISDGTITGIPEDLVAILTAMNQAEEGQITLGEGANSITFTGYTGDKDIGSWAYHSGMIDGLHGFLSTPQNVEKFANLYGSDNVFKNHADSFMNKHGVGSKYGFRKQYSGEAGQGFGEVTPLMMEIYQNFKNPMVRDIFKQYFDNYAGETSVGADFTTGLSEDMNGLIIYEPGELNESKASNGIVMPHNDQIKLSFSDLVPELQAPEAVNKIKQIAAVNDMSVAELLSTLKPDRALYNKGDFVGAYRHVKTAIHLAETDIGALDPQQGSGFQLNNENMDAILNILESNAGTLTKGLDFDSSVAEKAIALHMKSNKFGDKFTTASNQSIENYISTLSGLKMADIAEGLVASDKAITQLNQLRNIIEKTGRTGATFSLSGVVANLFGDGGQVSQLATALGFSRGENAEEYDSTISFYQKQLDGLNMQTAEGQQRALKVGLAFALARAEDPSGRLSNQDVEAQLARIGLGAITSVDSALAALDQVLFETKELQSYYQTFSGLTGDTPITAEQQRNFDAKYVVRLIQKYKIKKLGEERMAQQSSSQPFTIS